MAPRLVGRTGGHPLEGGGALAVDGDGHVRRVVPAGGAVRAAHVDQPGGAVEGRAGQRAVQPGGQPGGGEVGAGVPQVLRPGRPGEALDQPHREPAGVLGDVAERRDGPLAPPYGDGPGHVGARARPGGGEQARAAQVVELDQGGGVVLRGRGVVQRDGADQPGQVRDVLVLAGLDEVVLVATRDVGGERVGLLADDGEQGPQRLAGLGVPGPDRGRELGVELVCGGHAGHLRGVSGPGRDGCWGVMSGRRWPVRAAPPPG